VILVVCVISDNGVNNRLKDVFLRDHAVHVLDEVVGLVDFVVLEVINDEVQPGLGEDVNEGR
jgi:hypothetical protein